MESQKTKRKSIFENPLLSTKIKSANVKLFPETGLGYLIGPMLALTSNAVVNTYLAQYWNTVLGLKEWAPLFSTILFLVSSILIVLGNLLVGRLAERKPSVAGKVRPLILVALPLIAIALVVLFAVPFPTGATLNNPNILTLSMVAIGYNLYYAIAYPFYYTSHSSLVNLSTRDSSKRSLLATASNASQLGAVGLASMIGPFIIDALGLLPTGENGALAEEALRQEANSKWIIVIIIMFCCFLLGSLIEYFFTRERITEENIKLAETTREASVQTEEQAKKIPMKTQIKICLHDKYWWLIIAFFFLYQFGGMLKNNDCLLYSQAWIGDLSLQGTINIVGAIPTALGMLVIWPLANKFGKANTIRVGCFGAFLLGLVGFLVLPFGDNSGAVFGISIAGFCLKALGTVPAMYISLALMSDVLDHQEALYGKRTDGFTMALYGSIMVAMPGIANAIIYGLENSVPNELARLVHTFIFFGGESLCYLIMGILFIFMNVEKFSKIDHRTIVEDQKAKVEAQGGVFVSPQERMLEEQRASEEAVEAENLANLKARCEKKGLNYEAELAAYNEKKANALKAKEERKAAFEAKKEAMQKAKQAKIDAMSKEDRDAYEEKLKARKEKAEYKARVAEEEFKVLREKAQKYALENNL